MMTDSTYVVPCPVPLPTYSLTLPTLASTVHALEYATDKKIQPAVHVG